MDQVTPLSCQFGNLHLSRAEAILYLILCYVFGHIHPKYQRYIDDLAAHDTFSYVEQRAKAVEDFWWGKTDQLDTAQFKVTIPDLNNRAWLDFVCLILRKSVGWIERSEIARPRANARAPPINNPHPEPVEG